MTRSTEYIRPLLVRLARDRKGAISIVTAFSFTAMLGFAGLGTEASYWYVKKRSIQGAADSAAFTAAAAVLAHETFASSTTGTPVNAALGILASYGFTNGGGTTISITSPPTQGSHTGDNSAVEVIISQSQPRLLSALFIASNPTIIGRAVATQVSTNGPPCVMALDTGNVKQDLSDSGSSTINMPGCNMYVNSNSSDALNASGTVVINAGSTYVVGGDSLGGATLNDSVGTHLNTGTPYVDPFLSENFSLPGGCGGSATTLSITGTQTLHPGVYCGGIQINGASANVTLSPGTYYMNGNAGLPNADAGFAVLNGATVTGQGVTIVLTGTSGPSVGTVQITGANTTVTLNTTTDAPLDKLTFFQDRGATKTPALGSPTTENNFSGSANMNIGGGIYFPEQLVTYSGGATVGSANAPKCTELIAYRVAISGTTNFNSNCQGLGGNPSGGLGGATVISLVE